MDSSPVSGRRGVTDTAPAPSARHRASQDYARQVAADDAVRQQHRSANNREAARRMTQAAFRDSIEQERVRERQNMQAGVDKMVRSVVRKESARPEQGQESTQQSDPSSQAQYVREKLHSAYSRSAPESPRDERLRPSPSERQQQRAMENYQQSNRNSIDRTVELVV